MRLLLCLPLILAFGCASTSGSHRATNAQAACSCGDDGACSCASDGSGCSCDHD